MTTDYMRFLAVHVHSEEKIVSWPLIFDGSTLTSLPDHLPNAQSGAESPMQCGEEVQIVNVLDGILLTIFRMLYEFYTYENRKRPGSVHATYLLYGTQDPAVARANGASQQDGEDISMTSSPFMSSLPQDEENAQEPPIKAMSVVREENLDGNTCV